ncbi:MAG: hypothetical protein IID32_08270, partial [Planctomycetes bacterium]|nr:hypothetical protein [Planctomycetota bacterium]
TRALLNAIPQPDPHRKPDHTILSGEVPSPINPPSGCAFHPRCPLVTDRCKQESPQLEPKAGRQNHLAACWET